MIIEIQRQSYPSDLKEQEWQIIKPLLPEASRVGAAGRPQEWPYREILNAIFYIVKTGCQWRMLPHDLPPKDSVYYHFAKWRKNGVWQSINEQLVGQLRQAAGRDELPSAGVVDSQSVKTSRSAESRGFDAGKLVNGRKRHCLVDTMGLLLLIVVTTADVQDRDGAKLLLTLLKEHTNYRRMHLIWADGSYAGKLITWVRDTLFIVLSIIRRPKGSKGFILLKRRWVVERTFGWLSHYRRFSKDYEQQTENSAAMVYIAMCHLMLRRLAWQQSASP